MDGNIAGLILSLIFINILPAIEQISASSRIDSRGGFQIMRDPWLAGILSLLIPGLGQIYNGRVIIGVIWMLVFGVSWIGSVGMFGWIIHIISAWCAYSYAKDHPVRSSTDFSL